MRIQNGLAAARNGDIEAAVAAFRQAADLDPASAEAWTNLGVVLIRSGDEAHGVESGTLPTMLAKAATYYEQQVDQAVATLSSLIEPIMIVVMGAIAGSVIFALYLPIFSIGQAMRGGLR
jgi:tetratricopeptide (TPR) repeat protein